MGTSALPVAMSSLGHSAIPALMTVDADVAKKEWHLNYGLAGGIESTRFTEVAGPVGTRTGFAEKRLRLTIS